MIARSTARGCKRGQGRELEDEGGGEERPRIDREERADRKSDAQEDRILLWTAGSGKERIGLKVR